jgi:hypothetical protein
MRLTPDSRRLVTVTTAASPSGTRDARGRTRPSKVTRVPGGRLAISPDGRTAYTANRDGRLVGWDLTGTCRLGRPFDVGSAVPTAVAAIAPKSSVFAVADDRGNVELLDGWTGARMARVGLGVAGATRAERGW